MPRTKQNIPVNESNAQRYVRLANQRVNTILISLKGLGALGDTKLYEHKPEQRKKIKEAISTALESAISAMERGTSTQEFKL